MPDRSEHKTIMISAGEASGDLHGAHLVAAIKRLSDHVSFYGMGGARMQEAGVELIAQESEMAVLGLTEVAKEVLTHWKWVLSTMRLLKRSFLERKPDLVILIDYPDFHLPLARAAKKAGMKVLYYISPQVWAWRKGRIKDLRQCIDHMVVILPFEEELYRRAGIPVTFVGHPLLDVVGTRHQPEEARSLLGVDRNHPIIALLPGSRRSEAVRLLPVMLEAATLLLAHYPHAAFLLPRADTLDPALIDDFIASYDLPLRILDTEMRYDVLTAADFAVVASGTATLEVALMGTPMCIVYRLSTFTYLLGRMLIDMEYIGLANIIAQRQVVPELIQGYCSPQGIAETVKSILDDPQKVADITTALKEVKEKLGTPGAVARAARVVLEMVETHGNL